MGRVGWLGLFLVMEVTGEWIRSLRSAGCGHRCGRGGRHWRCCKWFLGMGERNGG